MKYSEEKGAYKATDDKTKFSEFNNETIEKKPAMGALGAFIGFIPGSILWLLLSYYTPFGGSMGIILAVGSLLGYRLLGKYMTYKVKNILVGTSLLIMILLTSVITAYTLYVQYTDEVLQQDSIDELRESFVTDLHNNGKTTEETEQLLRDAYNIDGFDDIDGLNKFVIKTLGETYMDSHKVTCVPDTPFNAIKCLYQSLSYNRSISKPYFFNIISGFVLCLVSAIILLRFEYFKPENFI